MFATISFWTSNNSCNVLKIRLKSTHFMAAVDEANALCMGFSIGRQLTATVETITSNRPKGEVVDISELGKVEW